MRSKQLIIILLLLIIPCGLLNSPVLAGRKSKDSWVKNCVWFDSKGVYHCGDIAEYLQKVQSGKTRDPELLQAINSVMKNKKKFSARKIVKIARALDPFKNIAAIYPDHKSFRGKQHSEIIKHFQMKPRKKGVLSVHTYVVRRQGNVGMLSGDSTTNMFLAIPADPEILTGANLSRDNEGTPLLEARLKAAVDQDQWTDYMVQLMPSDTGKIDLPEIAPGPWIIYQNQFGVMAFCYRVLVKPGVNKKVVADELLWRAQLGGK